jgi:hypothetical protein
LRSSHAQSLTGQSTRVFITAIFYRPREEIKNIVQVVNNRREPRQSPYIILGKTPEGDQYHGFYPANGGDVAIAEDLGTDLDTALTKVRDILRSDVG